MLLRILGKEILNLFQDWCVQSDFTMILASKPPSIHIHNALLFTGEFFTYNSDPYRLVLMKHTNCTIKFIIGEKLIQDLQQTSLAPEFCHMHTVQ